MFGIIRIPVISADDGTASTGDKLATPEKVELKMEKKVISGKPDATPEIKIEKEETNPGPEAGAPFTRARMTYDEMVQQWDGLEATREDGTTILFSSEKQKQKQKASEKETTLSAPFERGSAQVERDSPPFERGSSLVEKTTESDGKTERKTPGKAVESGNIPSSPKK